MFSINSHLLEHREVENVYGASVVDQDLVHVIVPYLDANDECIIMRVVKMLGILFWEANNGVVDPRHLRDDAC